MAKEHTAEAVSHEDVVYKVCKWTGMRAVSNFPPSFWDNLNQV